jgi:4-amino-4-deoxy-L-arabinose transferase-like glycosyltransferase
MASGQIYLLNITAAAITLTGVYFLGRALSGSQTAGLWLAVFWSVMSGHVWLEANQPNSEAFINGFTVWGLALVFWNPPCGRRWWLPVLAGACFALASLYKHVVVLIPAFLGGLMDLRSF